MEAIWLESKFFLQWNMLHLGEENDTWRIRPNATIILGQANFFMAFILSQC